MVLYQYVEIGFDENFLNKKILKHLNWKAVVHEGRGGGRAGEVHFQMFSNQRKCNQSGGPFQYPREMKQSVIDIKMKPSISVAQIGYLRGKTKATCFILPS